MQHPEIEWAGVVHASSNVRDVRRLQEWLTLHGVKVDIDGKFGRKTEEAVRAFQVSKALPATAFGDANTLAALVEPMRVALEDVPQPEGTSLGAATVCYARRHLDGGAQEIPPNCGPWVRLYMRNNEGDDAPWCAGFVCFVMQQAAATLRKSVPFRPSFGCSRLARAAIDKGRFVCGAQLDGRDLAGSIFVVPSKVEGRDPHGGHPSSGSWSHTGVVVAREGPKVRVIEGNTNLAGSREGTHVRERLRDVATLDYLTLD